MNKEKVINDIKKDLYKNLAKGEKLIIDLANAIDVIEYLEVENIKLKSTLKAIKSDIIGNLGNVKLNDLVNYIDILDCIDVALGSDNDNESL